MMPTDRFERQLPVALTDLAAPRTPDYLTDILGRTARTRQRPAWASIERWLPMELVSQRATISRMPWRQIGVLALLAALLAGMIAIYAGSHQRRAAPAFGLASTCGVSVVDSGTLYVADPATGQQRAVYAGSASNPELDGLISRDGTKIAVVTGTADVNETVSIVPVDGGPAVPLQGGPFNGLHSVDWSPQGDVVAITADIVGSDGHAVQHLILARADGSGSQVVEPGFPINGIAFRPPDGQELLAEATIEGRDTFVVLRRDGTFVRELVGPSVSGSHPPIFAAAYAPDGTQLAFMASDRSTSVNTIWVGPAVAPSEAVQIGTELAPWSAAGPPAWSNAGDRLALTRATGSSFRLSTYDVASRALRDIGPVSRVEWPAVTWSPDDVTLLVLPAEGGLQFQVDSVTGNSVPTPWKARNYPSFRRCA
jgi:hypothetical protein